MRRGLTRMGREGVDFVLEDGADIDVPALGAYPQSAPQKSNVPKPLAGRGRGIGLA